ncbi:MAG: radical SAM family heme chaperone HemW [Oscillospiraceae bacterium]|nr:radical SAM family heme chaperone HemW [Candidatus Limimonas coprohippi]
MESSGLYIHIPFCKSLCPYCDFYKVRFDEELEKKYVEAVEKSTASLGISYSSEAFDTVYFGGGTPSCLSGESIVKILDALRLNFNILPDAEITVECNPSSNLEIFIPVVANAGVNRISLGLQSANENERRLLGRISGTERVREVLDICKNSGITNISLDLMLGVPGQTLDSLKDSLNFCLDSGVSHVSAYMLKIEEGTVFYKRQETLDLPSEDLVCDMYELTCKTLNDGGLSQYEISNFGLPSKHNIKYWRDETYLGIGPGAHSYMNGKRFYYPKDINAFINGDLKEVPDGDGGAIEEKVMLGLRLTSGIGFLEPATLKLISNDKSIEPFISIDEGTLSLNQNGFLVSNAVILKILEYIK